MILIVIFFVVWIFLFIFFVLLMINMRDIFFWIVMKLLNVEFLSWVWSFWRNFLFLFVLFWEVCFVCFGGDDFVFKINMICLRILCVYLKFLFLIVFIISFFNFGNVLLLWWIFEVFVLVIVCLMLLIVLRNLFDGEVWGLYIFCFFWYVIIVCVIGFGVVGIIMLWFVVDIKIFLSIFFVFLIGWIFLDIFIIFKLVLLELGISFVVLFGVRIFILCFEFIEKFINVLCVNWSDGRRFLFDFFMVIDKSKIVVVKIIMVCFFMMRKSVVFVVLNCLSSVWR